MADKTPVQYLPDDWPYRQRFLDALDLILDSSKPEHVTTQTDDPYTVRTTGPHNDESELDVARHNPLSGNGEAPLGWCAWTRYADGVTVILGMRRGGRVEYHDTTGGTPERFVEFLEKAAEGIQR